MSTLGRTPSIQPWFAVLLSGLSTALAVAASLFVSQFGATASVLAIGLSFTFGVTVTYATSYQPLIQLNRRRRSLLVDIILRQLTSVYRNEIADCDLRANVMTIDRLGYLPWHSDTDTLSIEYASNGYSKWERELVYRMGEGPAGKAMQERKIIDYDAKIHRHLERGMTVEQCVATDRVNAAVSIPLYPRSDSSRRPTGVLTLDSPQYVGKTKFNDEAARTLLVKYANAIEAVIQ